MIFCILVTYNPDFQQLQATLSSILSQVDKIVVVNNNSTPLNLSNAKIHVIELCKNFGIAYAQNRGIEYAISNKADYVLFSDQDTIYPNDFINKSVACYQRHKDEKIAAVVPLFFNENKKQFARLNTEKTKSVSTEIGKDYYLAHAISSGTFCHTSVFSTVGLMNERLFIDYVDYEWCWRAVKQKYNIVCDTTNTIHHNMGDSYKTVFGRKIVVYSDFRNYYFFRNGTYLLFHSHLLSLKEWLSFYKFMTVKAFLFFITCGFSLKHLKLYIKSIFRGMLNTFSAENDFN